MASAKSRKAAPPKAKKPVQRRAKAAAARRKHKPAVKSGAMPPKLDGPKKRAFDAIHARANALAASLTAADFDGEGNPVNPAWVAMLADLDAWAAKHKFQLKTHEHDHGEAGASGTPTPYVACPGTTTNTSIEGGLMKYKISYLCTLKRRTLLGRCVYSCVTTGWTYL